MEIPCALCTVCKQDFFCVCAVVTYYRIYASSVRYAHLSAGRADPEAPQHASRGRSQANLPRPTRCVCAVCTD